jgi:hypothetical protein
MRGELVGVVLTVVAGSGTTPAGRCGLVGVVSGGVVMLNGEEGEEDGAGDGGYGAIDDADDGVDQAAEDDDSQDEVLPILDGTFQWRCALVWRHQRGGG